MKHRWVRRKGYTPQCSRCGLVAVNTKQFTQCSGRDPLCDAIDHTVKKVRSYTRLAKMEFKKAMDARFVCGRIACTPCVKDDEECGHCIATAALIKWNMISPLMPGLPAGKSRRARI